MFLHAGKARQYERPAIPPTVVDTVWTAGKEQCIQSFLDPNAFSKYNALVGKKDVDRKSKTMESQRPIIETWLYFTLLLQRSTI